MAPIQKSASGPPPKVVFAISEKAMFAYLIMQILKTYGPKRCLCIPHARKRESHFRHCRWFRPWWRPCFRDGRCSNWMIPWATACFHRDMPTRKLMTKVPEAQGKLTDALFFGECEICSFQFAVLYPAKPSSFLMSKTFCPNDMSNVGHKKSFRRAFLGESDLLCGRLHHPRWCYKIFNC